MVDMFSIVFLHTSLILSAFSILHPRQAAASRPLLLATDLILNYIFPFVEDFNIFFIFLDNG